MGRFVLEVGRIAAVLGCVASVIGDFLSVADIIDQWNRVTDELLGRPFFWLYLFVINGALSVVFTRVIGISEAQAFEKRYRDQSPGE